MLSEENNNMTIKPVLSQTPQQPNRAQTQIVRKSNKKRTIMWSGIILLLFVVLFAFITLGIPQIIGQINHCNPFAEGGNDCGTLGLCMIGIAGLVFFGIPITLTGVIMILYSILK